MRSRLVTAIALLTVATGFTGRAEAHVFNALGRYLGIGWSNGYHSQDACCPGPVWAFRPGFGPPPHPMCGPPTTSLFQNSTGGSSLFAPSYGGSSYSMPPAAVPSSTPWNAAPTPAATWPGGVGPLYPVP